MADVEQQIAALEAMSSSALRDEWRRLTGTAAPKISPAMTRLALAWEIQARAYGGLPRATRQMLDCAHARPRSSGHRNDNYPAA